MDEKIELIPRKQWGKKQSEEGKQVINFFEKYCSLSGIPIISAVKNDPPDFVAEFDGGKTWYLEHTRLYRETPDGQRPMKEEEARRDALMRFAQSEYERHQNVPVIVQLQFRSGFNLDPQTINESAVNIAKMVLKVVPKDGTGVDTNIYHDTFSDIPWIEGLGYISVYRFSNQNDARWSGHGAEWAGQLTVKSMNEIIVKKEKKVFKNINETGLKVPQSILKVLLCVIEGTLHSSSIDSRDIEKIQQTTFQTNFDKIFIWNHSAQSYYELLVQHSGIT